jgi:hypothetical protein
MRFQQREDFAAMPAGVAEFSAEPYPAGDLLQEIGQPGVIARV